jgi:hypothetical protein
MPAVVRSASVEPARRAPASGTIRFRRVEFFQGFM